jgi:RecJ-like exonuclease
MPRTIRRTRESPLGCLTVDPVTSRLSFLRRLTADTQTLDAAELQSDVARCDASPLRTLRRGEVVTVTGRLRAVEYTPRETVPTLRAELFDGSASIDLIWLGRRRVAGIEPGRTVMAHGRVGVHDDRLAIYNPWYELRVPV